MPPRLEVDWNAETRIRGYVRIYLDTEGYRTPSVRFDTRWWVLDRSLKKRRCCRHAFGRQAP